MLTKRQVAYKLLFDPKLSIHWEFLGLQPSIEI